MGYILSNTTAAEMQLVCRTHQVTNGTCDPKCPQRCVCGEQVRDWPVRESEVGFDQNPYAGGDGDGRSHNP